MADATASLREDLLRVMDRKDHGAWPHFRDGRATREQLRIHYQQEFATYVRDFPVFLARVHSRCPVAAVRRDLAENLFEEETGKLSLGVPHPELFLRMMAGLGLPREGFESAALLPEAAAYRAWIDRVTLRRPWIESAALTAIFIEGSVEDRRRLQGETVKGREEVEAGLRRDPLVRHYGVDPSHLDLKRAHSMVEGEHRRMAWRMVLGHVENAREGSRVRRTLERALTLWLHYRDGVARACGIDPRATAAA